jgi:hypothetical protein
MPPLSTLSAFSSVIPLAIGLWKHRHLDQTLKVLLALAGLTFVTEMTMLSLTNYGYRNLWLIHFFTPIQYSLLAWIFAAWIQDRKARRAIKVSIPLFWMWSAIVFLWIEQTTSFSTYSRSLEAFLVVTISAYALIELSKREVASLLTFPAFWVCIAVLVYFTGSAVIYASSNILLELSLEALTIAWTAKGGLNILANLFLGIGFTCHRRP